MRSYRLLLAATLSLASAPHVLAAPPAAPWTHTASDLPPDPAVRYGVLPNGMKFAILQNETPAGEASLRLRIDAGSLAEAEAQRGVAHFLEHMAFNGSKGVPEGEMVRILERAGLAFGPDTNAYTGFTETVYQLDLPETDAKTLDTGLFLLRETAGELLLAPEAIDRERGIILAEERARANPALRVYEARLGFLLKDQLPAERMPIGKTEIIRSAPRAAFADFYARHYRPDAVTLVVVGDVDPVATEALIRAKFGPWTPTATAAAAAPALGPVAVRRAGEAKVVIEPGSGLSVQLAWVGPPDLAPDTRAKRTADTPEAIGFAVLNRRFERLARAADPAFIAASAGSGNEEDAAEVTSISATAQPGRWREALAAIEQEQRRLLRFGAQQAEVDREITEYRGALTARVAGAATRRSPGLASQIVASVDDDEVFTSPATDLAVFEASVKGLTAQRVTAALRDAFKAQGPLLFVSTPVPIDGGETAVASAYTGSTKVAVAAPAALATARWPYADWGRPGTVAERSEVADLQTSFVRFANGVRLTVRPSVLKKDEILVAVRIGDGRLAVPADRETVAWAAPFSVADGGTTDLTNEELDSLTAGKVLSAGFAIDDEAFVFSGRTRPEDFATQLQLLTAYTAKPGLRPEAFARIKSFGPTLLDQFESTPSGILQRDLGALLRADDPRWRFPDREELAAAKPEELRALLAGPLAAGAIEVVITGDVTVEQAVEQVGRTFGALPPRPAAMAPTAQARALRFPAAAPTPVGRTHKGRADQGVGYIAWPTVDFFSDPQRARAVRMLEGVMDLRLTDELREKQGATYSPFTGFAASTAFTGYGYVAAGIEAPPDALPAFYADVAKIAAALRDAPPTADEMDRARRPRLEALQRARAGNEYWTGNLAGAQTDPRRLAAIREAVSGTEKVTAADVQAAARLYLTDDKAWRLAVTPAAAPPAAAR